MSRLEFETGSRLKLALRDTAIMIKRSSRHIIRNIDQLLGTFFQPIMFLVLFAAVFGGAIELGLPDGVSYLNFLMAGIIVQTVAFGSTTTAIAVSNDLQKGIVDRFRSLPMNNLAVLTGHVISDVFRNTISTVVMILAGLAIGFRPQANLLEWGQILLLLILFTLTFSWLMAIVGVIAKSVEAVQWLTFILIFPLTFASSAFVPVDGMPSGLKWFAENQPITQVIEAIRSLFLGTATNNFYWVSVVWCIGAMIVAVPMASYVYRKKASS